VTINVLILCTHNSARSVGVELQAALTANSES